MNEAFNKMSSLEKFFYLKLQEKTITEKQVPAKILNGIKAAMGENKNVK